MSASWTPGTEKSYSSARRLWCSWRHERGLTPFPTSITPIVEFITHHFQEGKQYSTLNFYRSALSATIPPIEGKPVGQTRRALQGSFNQRPPRPRYSTTWDVTLVVTFLQEHVGSNQTLSLKQLSLKVTTLLALANATRASDLVALDTRFIQRNPEGMLFRIPGLTKTRRSGPPRTMSVAKFEDEMICPVATLEHYLEQDQWIK